jgi:polysaccharide export outer membrane protein
MNAQRSPLLPFLAAAVLAWVSLNGAVPVASAQQPLAAKTKVVYALAVTDRIRVSIFGEEDLGTDARVDAFGNINLPLVGDVHVAGLSVDDAQKLIEKEYRDGQYLRRPQATISIAEYAPREVSIQGQVKEPGRFLLPTESTYSVVELVTKAGGFTDIAKGSEVTITHFTPDGKKTVRKVDVQSIIQGKGTSKSQDNSLMLEPGDIVYVPESII